MRYPSEAEALYLLRKYRLFKEIIEHSKNVARIAVKIAEDIRAAGHEVDVGLVRSAALLHDIGKWKYNRQKGGLLLHAYESGRLLKELGWPELAEVCESHFGLNKEEAMFYGCPEPHDMLPKSLEAKIVFIADKIRPGRSSKEDIIKYFDRKAKDWKLPPDMKERLISRIVKIWEELERLGMRV
ncbi:MAG: HD domain-containing protein [Candidatus Aenigmatarchaeota archaeon]|nr:HD domain-containing protein [Candidatus Aenigmarchaeota archaeon]